MFLQQLLNGLTTGSVYALIALGYTMIYGILGLINFAQGEFAMLGALLAISLIAAGMPQGLALVVAVLAVGLAFVWRKGGLEWDR